MVNKRIVLLVVTIIVLSLSTCTSWSAKEWKDLKNRNFSFTRFALHNKGSRRETALKFMEDFPVKKILKIISHKYNIVIDSSEFEAFILSEDISQLQVKGILVDEIFTWKSNIKSSNNVEFDYIVSMGQGGFEETIYRISLKVDGKERDLFVGNIFEKEPVLVTIAGGLGYSRANEKSDDFYVNKNDNTRVSLVSDGLDKIPVGLRKEKLNETKTSENHIKKLIKDHVMSLPQESKKKFRDDIIKFLYQVIE